MLSREQLRQKSAELRQRFQESTQRSQTLQKQAKRLILHRRFLLGARRFEKNSSLLKDIRERREFLASFQTAEQQEVPFEYYFRVSGEATIDGILQKTVERKRMGQTSIIIANGSLAEGKSTFSDKLREELAKSFEPDEIAICTAEENERIATTQKGGPYPAEVYSKGAKNLEKDILETLNDEKIKLVLIEAPATTGILLPYRDELLGMDRGTSAIKNIFGINCQWGDRYSSMLVGAIGLTNENFKEALKERRDIFYSRKIAERGGTYPSTLAAENEIRNLLMQNDYELARLFGIPIRSARLYPNDRREIQLARLNWLYMQYFGFTQDVTFIGEVKPKKKVGNNRSYVILKNVISLSPTRQANFY